MPNVNRLLPPFVMAVAGLVVSVLSLAAAASGLGLSNQAIDYQWVAKHIEQNETGGHAKYLTYWSRNEPFPSFGIGHFIWIPKNVSVPFEQTFPQMVAFVSARRPAPEWLQSLTPFEPPWPNRAAFDQAWSKPKLTELRQWLAATKSEQAEFIFQRLVAELDRLWPTLTPAQQQHLSYNVNQLTQTPQGVFAMIDYANFKGIGHNAKERYLGEGWGLVDVLLAMPETTEARALPDFVASAKARLQLRVKLSPLDKSEKRWLPGWEKRLNRYLTLS